MDWSILEKKKFKELEHIIAFNGVKAIISDSWKSIEYPINKIRNKKIPVVAGSWKWNCTKII